MTSYLSKLLNEILDNGDDETIVNWVFDHRRDILDALDAWSKPTEGPNHKEQRVNLRDINEVRKIVTGEDFSGEAEDEAKFYGLDSEPGLNHF